MSLNSPDSGYLKKTKETLETNDKYEDFSYIEGLFKTPKWLHFIFC